MKKEIDIEQGKRRESGKDDGGKRRGKRGERKECNVTADKVSIAGLSAASMIRASYNESRGE